MAKSLEKVEKTTRHCCKFDFLLYCIIQSCVGVISKYTYIHMCSCTIMGSCDLNLSVSILWFVFVYLSLRLQVFYLPMEIASCVDPTRSKSSFHPSVCHRIHSTALPQKTQHSSALENSTQLCHRIHSTALPQNTQRSSATEYTAPLCYRIHSTAVELK